MAKLKKLQISEVAISSSATNCYIDMEEQLLAKEHINYYIIKNSNETTTNRIYLSFEKQMEFHHAKISRGDRMFHTPPSLSKKHLFTHFPEHEKLIKELTIRLSTAEIEYGYTIKILKGFYIFLYYINTLNYDLNSINDINNKLQVKIYKEVNNSSLSKQDKVTLRSFFNYLEKIMPEFIAITFNNINYSSIESLRSEIVYQLDFYSRVELSEIIQNAEEYLLWMEEFNSINLFSIENLAKTYYDEIEKYGNKRNSENRKYNKIAILLHNIELKSWSYRRGEEITYKNKEQEKTHKMLLDLANKGINIDIKDERMFSFWFKELFPNYPFEKAILEKYKFLFPSVNKLVYQVNKKVAINFRKFTSRIFPTANRIYPLILFLMIREGINAEVLRNWKVKKNKENQYTIGDRTPISLIIDAVKNRSNSIISTIISNDSEQLKYIEFYLKWLTPLYDFSNKTNFFQFMGGINLVNVSEWDKKSFFETIIHSPDYLLKKYVIRDINGKKFNRIAHNKLRPYSNYADYLRGYSEFIRQYKKGHKKIDTQIHYENNVEWNNQKKYNIARTQELLINIFRGTIEREENLLFEPGLFADCINPKEPTYYGAKLLRDNESCMNWKKCLTHCNKSCVIPKIHGKVIYAWFIFMEEEKEEFISQKDWEKEYLYDYHAAKVVFNGFTEEEKEFCKENYKDYMNIVKLKFKDKVKLGLAQ